MPKPLANREDVFEVAKAFVTQGVKTSVISERTGVNPKTIRTWSRRYGWIKTASIVRQDVNQAVTATVVDDLKSIGGRVREALAVEIESQAQLLAKEPAESIKDLATSQGKQGRAVIVKTIAETAGNVFGWNESPKERPLLQIGMVEKLDVRAGHSQA